MGKATGLPDHGPQVAPEPEPSRLGNVRQLPPPAHDADLECCQTLDGLVDDFMRALARGEINLRQACEALADAHIGN